MLPTRQELPVTKTVDAIMDGSLPGTGVEDFITFDPKLPKAAQAPQGQTKRTNFLEAIVFVIGGGNYHEYHNLMEYTQRSNLVKKTVIYGSTDLISSSKFIMELEVLGTPNQ